MKNKFIAMLLLFLALVVFAVPASATGNGKKYVEVQAGVVFFNDADAAGSPSVVGNSNLSANDGYLLGLTIGRSFQNNFRVELEGTYRRNSLDALSGVREDAQGNLQPSCNSHKPKSSTYSSFFEEVDGNINALSAMFNVLYDANNSTIFTPYVGAGAGVARVSLKTNEISDRDTVFAYQAIAGIGVSLTLNTAFDLGYKYFVAQDPSFGLEKIDYKTHNVVAGLRYSF